MPDGSATAAVRSEAQAPAAGPGSASTRTGSWAGRDTLAACALAGLPALLLSLAAGIGYPLMTGDDVAQSFPLSVLTGRILDHGHLPLFDAGLWSGAPLLGGANAHALLPLSLLFAVIPPLAAWVTGEVVVLAAAAIGCQLLLRRTGCSTVAAALGGATFGLGSFLSSQMVHLDFAAAAAALPWAIVAMEGIARRAVPARPRHALLLAVAVAWVSLAGSPDIVIDAVALGLLYLAHLLAQPTVDGRRVTGRLAVSGWTTAGVVSGLAVGALQWLPAARFVAVSQRAHPGPSFLSAGSATAANLLTLFVPHLLGGGPIGLSRYTSGFPLAEIDAYPGVLALVALAVLTARWRAGDAWRWRIWLVVAVAGVVLALGGHTPLERALGHLPIFGQQRLPSRALILVALSAAMALGYYLDGLLAGRPEWRMRSSVAAGLVPAAAVFGVVLATFISGRPAGGALHPLAGRGWSVAAVAPALALSCALSGGAVAVVLAPRPGSGEPRRPRRRLVWLAVGLVVVDLLLFDANQSSLAPIRAAALDGGGAGGAGGAGLGATGTPTNTEQRAIARLAGGGRYLLVDPALVGGLALDRAGPPDLSLLAGLSSAEGYGSLTWGPYAAETGTHSQASVSANALVDGAFDALGVRLVLVLPSGLHGSARARLLSALRAPHYVREGHVGPFLAYRDTRAAGLWSGAEVRVLTFSPWTGASTVLVRAARGTSVVRSMAALPGWQATEQAAGDPSSRPHPVPVTRHGLVQSVRVPAGTTVLSLAYVPPGWVPAQWAGLGGAAAWVGLALLGLRRRPRWLRRRPRWPRRRPRWLRRRPRWPRRLSELAAGSRSQA